MNNRELQKMTMAEAALTLLIAVGAFFFAGKWAGLTALIAGIALIAMNLIYTYRRYKEIENINHTLDRVLAGDNDLEVWDNKEGELSVLKSNIYKATSILITQREKLKKEKVFLADAIADISHQLKTPLTSMMVMNDLLQNEENEDKRKEFIGTQQTQLERMNWLIQTLLKISKLDTETITFKEEDVDAVMLVKESVDPFLVAMDLKGITFVNNTKDIKIKCDLNWTKEAVGNIVKNCIEHMTEGGILTISTTETNIYNSITISDTGSGIDPEDLPHIFERFYRGKKASSESVGIGLALSDTIVGKQRGEIKVESTPGKGSIFEMRFYKTII